MTFPLLFPAFHHKCNIYSLLKIILKSQVPEVFFKIMSLFLLYLHVRILVWLLTEANEICLPTYSYVFWQLEG